MNERITKLEDQCFEDNPNTGPVVFNREKFAELIVQECIKTLADNSEFRGCVIIVKHFKVEE